MLPTPLKQRRSAIDWASAPDFLRYAWMERDDPDTERYEKDIARLREEEDKQRADLRKLRFQMLLQGWEVEKWEQQAQVMAKELETHDKELEALQASIAMAQ
ncbi:hypothetical protein HK097_009494 [Rhizophlyctis rosea]|uniref:Uncharacterized protein n=1 Tax=Rhizophlyctis rosea TaxID=64517 RepID=A0AAD5SAH2_9FUNG|nr:hypothetical protein HK097_009494 [Rhizophlyctis rosea]